MNEVEHTLFFDGGAQPNPGKGGCGWVIKKNSNGLIVKSAGKDVVISGVSVVTNNQAEYHGLIEGLRECVKMGIHQLIVKGDSQLVINQMRTKENGEPIFKCIDVKLIPLYAQAIDLTGRFSSIDFVWIRREENSEADELARSFILSQEFPPNGHYPVKQEGGGANRPSNNNYPTNNNARNNFQANNNRFHGNNNTQNFNSNRNNGHHQNSRAQNPDNNSSVGSVAGAPVRDYSNEWLQALQTCVGDIEYHQECLTVLSNIDPTNATHVPTVPPPPKITPPPTPITQSHAGSYASSYKLGQGNGSATGGFKPTRGPATRGLGTSYTYGGAVAKVGSIGGSVKDGSVSGSVKGGSVSDLNSFASLAEDEDDEDVAVDTITSITAKLTKLTLSGTTTGGGIAVNNYNNSIMNNNSTTKGRTQVRYIVIKTLCGLAEAIRHSATSHSTQKEYAAAAEAWVNAYNLLNSDALSVSIDPWFAIFVDAQQRGLTPTSPTTLLQDEHYFDLLSELFTSIHILQDHTEKERNRALQYFDKQLSRVNQKLNPLKEGRDEVKSNWGEQKWNNNPAPKMDYAERMQLLGKQKRELEIAIQLVSTLHLNIRY